VSATSVRKALLIDVGHELVVLEPSFGVDRWPHDQTLAFGEQHLNCSLKMDGRKNPQLCVLATAIAQHTDDTIAFLNVEADEVSFYVYCEDGEEAPEAEYDTGDCIRVQEWVVLIDDPKTWHVASKMVDARRVAVYHHDRNDIIDLFDQGSNHIPAGEVRLRLSWTKATGWLSIDTDDEEDEA